MFIAIRGTENFIYNIDIGTRYSLETLANT